MKTIKSEKKTSPITSSNYQQAPPSDIPSASLPTPKNSPSPIVEIILNRVYDLIGDEYIPF